MLRLISYLAPSIPAAFFELVAGAIAAGAGVEVELRFEERISGPLPGDENPFADATADVGFVCSPTYQWLREELELLPVPVPTDERSGGRPVYFGDVVVRADAAFSAFDELRDHRWAYNDRNSRSGWFSMLDRIGPLAPDEFFGEIVHAGSHLESLHAVEMGRADAAAIDSNALRHEMKRRSELRAAIRIIESWGPFPIQPIVIRAGIPTRVKDSVRGALLRAHEAYAEQLMSFGFARFANVEGSEYGA